MTKTCILVGAPVDSGKRKKGCSEGPAAYRAAGLAQALTALGHRVSDWGDAKPNAVASSSQVKSRTLCFRPYLEAWHLLLRVGPDLYSYFRAFAFLALFSPEA